MFKAEFFNAVEWTELFRKAGARYVVLTAKHMEGFTLWPNNLANMNYGCAWNSVDTGPRRDLVGELSSAVKESGLKMGLYFMLYEALSPLYQESPSRFIEEVSIPQFKELYKTYTPSIVWVDGAWQHSAEEYKSAELIDWVYETLPDPDEIVLNNRWGAGLEHVGHATTEYTYMLEPESMPDAWEECRGMGESFGFNRNERLEDYNSAQALVLLLIDVVSNGGNLLLNIGPTHDGRIPIFMQERLLAIGEWLKRNGESIYGTTKYRTPCQWSVGKRIDINPRNLNEPITDGIAERNYILKNFDILKLTVDPEPGQAVKSIMFTRKGSILYAITPAFPRKTLVIEKLSVSTDTEISLVGSDRSLTWRQQGDDLEVDIPAELLLETGHQHAYVFKITKIMA